MILEICSCCHFLLKLCCALYWQKHLATDEFSCNWGGEMTLAGFLLLGECNLTEFGILVRWILHSFEHFRQRKFMKLLSHRKHRNANAANAPIPSRSIQVQILDPVIASYNVDSFSHIFSHFLTFSHIFSHFLTFSHIFSHFLIFSHIFSYFLIFCPLTGPWGFGLLEKDDLKVRNAEVSWEKDNEVKRLTNAHVHLSASEIWSSKSANDCGRWSCTDLLWIWKVAFKRGAGNELSLQNLPNAWPSSKVYELCTNCRQKIMDWAWLSDLISQS